MNYIKADFLNKLFLLIAFLRIKISLLSILLYVRMRSAVTAFIKQYQTYFEL